jgi:hypothetical protein
MNQIAALFFPYTRLSETRLKRALSLCNRIILYQLPVSQGIGGSNDLEAVPELIRQQVDFFDNPEELKAILAEFRGLTETHRDRESLAAFRNIFQDTSVEQAGSKLMSAVRQSSQREDPEMIADRSAQILLHFLEDLDSRQAEVNGLMAQVAEKELGLSDVMGVDHDDELPLDATGPGATLTDRVSDPFMTRRLAAWARLYKAFGPHDIPLLTDSAEALSVLDTGLARLMGGPGPLNNRTMEALEPIFRFNPTGADLSESEAQALESFITRLSSRAWEKKELAGFQEEGAGMFGPFDTDQAGPALTAFLMPGRDRVQAILAGTGASSVKPDTDYLVGPLLYLE